MTDQPKPYTLPECGSDQVRLRATVEALERAEAALAAVTAERDEWEKTSDMNAVHASKVEAERDGAQMLADSLRETLDYSVGLRKQAEAERDRMREALSQAQRFWEDAGFRVDDDVPEVDGAFEMERIARAALASTPAPTNGTEPAPKLVVKFNGGNPVFLIDRAARESQIVGYVSEVCAAAGYTRNDTEVEALKMRVAEAVATRERDRVVAFIGARIGVGAPEVLRFGYLCPLMDLAAVVKGVK